jgi:hypothetical protein
VKNQTLTRVLVQLELVFVVVVVAAVLLMVLVLKWEFSLLLLLPLLLLELLALPLFHHQQRDLEWGPLVSIQLALEEDYEVYLPNQRALLLCVLPSFQQYQQEEGQVLLEPFSPPSRLPLARLL